MMDKDLLHVLRNIHLRDMNECKDDMTDGADDKQIDAIIIDW